MYSNYNGTSSATTAMGIGVQTPKQPESIESLLKDLFGLAGSIDAVARMVTETIVGSMPEPSTGQNPVSVPTLIERLGALRIILQNADYNLGRTKVALGLNQ